MRAIYIFLLILFNPICLFSFRQIDTVAKIEQMQYLLIILYVVLDLIPAYFGQKAGKHRSVWYQRI